MLVQEDPKYMIGREYPIYQKGTLVFTKHLGRDSQERELYELICTECSKDQELYPDPFKTTREDFAENDAPCSCAFIPKYSPRQTCIIKNRIKALSKATTPRGYDNSKSGNLYLTLWEGTGVKLLKVGITNRDPSTRVKEQERRSQMKPTNLRVYHNSDGKVIETLEKSLLDYKKTITSLTQQAEIKKLLPDGYTEVFFYSEDNYKHLIEFFDNL